MTVLPAAMKPFLQSKILQVSRRDVCSGNPLEIGTYYYQQYSMIFKKSKYCFSWQRAKKGAAKAVFGEIYKKTPLLSGKHERLYKVYKKCLTEVR